jgi:hypothetical protein
MKVAITGRELTPSGQSPMISVMPRGAILFGFACPFIAAIILGVPAGLFGVEFLLDCWPVMFGGAAGVMVGMYQCWPVHWPEPVKAVLTMVLSIPIVGVEVWLAVRLMVIVCALAGGILRA